MTALDPRTQLEVIPAIRDYTQAKAKSGDQPFRGLVQEADVPSLRRGRHPRVTQQTARVTVLANGNGDCRTPRNAAENCTSSIDIGGRQAQSQLKRYKERLKRSSMAKVCLEAG